MNTKSGTSRIQRATAIGLTLSVGALLSACSGHGAYTTAGLNKSEQRLGAIKAGAEFETARQQFLSGELDKAQKTIELSISLAPTVAKSHVLLGRVFIEKGEYEKALDALAEAIKIDPENLHAHFHRGAAFERISHWDEALAEYRTCATLEPNDARFLVAQSDMLLEKRDREGAQKLLSAAMERFPNSAEIRRSLGAVALLDGLPDLAARLLREARLLDPDDIGVLEDLSRAEMSAGRFAEAELALNDLLKKDGMEARRDLMHMRVRCLVEMDRLVDARTALLSLTRDRDGEADRQAWLTLGRVSLKLNDMPRLRTCASRLIALEPTRPDGRLLMAAWQRRRGDLEGSLRSINTAIEIAPRQEEAWVMRGVVLGQLGRQGESEEALRTARAMRDTSVTAEASNKPSALATVVDDDSSR